MNGESPTDVASPRPVRSRRLPAIEGIWVFVFADMTVFGVLFVLFMVGRNANPALYEASRYTLDANIGGINTLILLTSSWAIARAVSAAQRDQIRTVPHFIAGAAVCGVAFAVLKIIEYRAKLNANISLLTNDFYMYYYTITGIHLGHVLVGCVVLTVMWFKARNGDFRRTKFVTLEAAATYWHMVDLLWILLFTLLYLLR